MTSETSQPLTPRARQSRITLENSAHSPPALTTAQIREAISAGVYVAKRPGPSDVVLTLLTGLARDSRDVAMWAAQEREEGSSRPWRAVRLERVEIVSVGDARALVQWRLARKQK